MKKIISILCIIVAVLTGIPAVYSSADAPSDSDLDKIVEYYYSKYYKEGSEEGSGIEQYLYSDGDGVHDANDKTADVSVREIEGLMDILEPAVSWDEYYEGESSFYGEGFELEIQYNDIRVKSSGKFAFPDDYEELHEKVLKWLNNVLNCSKS